MRLPPTNQWPRRLWPVGLLGLLLALALGQAAASDDSLPSPLKLSQALDIALSQNPALAAARHQEAASAERITQARAGFMPQVFFTEKFNRTTNPMWAFGTLLNQSAITSRDFDPDQLNDPDPINNFGSNFSLVWPLFDSGATWYGWHQSKLGHDAAVLETGRARQQTIARTAIAYNGLLLRQANLVVVDQTLASARAHLIMIRNRYDNGFGLKSDLLRGQVRVAELEQGRFQAVSDEEIARAKLNAAMGVAIETRFKPTTPLAAGPALADPLEDWTRKALSQRQDLKALELQETIARQEVSKARAAHLPRFDVIADYEINSEDFDETADNYTLGAMVRLNLFSGQRLSAKSREALAALEALRAQLAETKLGIRVETREAFLTAQSAWQGIDAAAQAVGQAEEALRIVRHRFQNGLMTLVELLDAEVALQAARNRHLQTLHDYQVARTRLALATGSLDVNFK